VEIQENDHELVKELFKIWDNLHNLFGDTNVVHVVTRDENTGYKIEQVIDGETVAGVLEYAQYNAKKLVYFHTS
jgi:arginine decarboxylase